MTILPTRSASLAPVPAAQSRGRAAGQGFSVPTDAPGAARLASAEVASSSLEQLLALQETGLDMLHATDPEHPRNRRGRQHAGALLDRLSQMQRALLGGGPAAGDLQDLARLARDMPEVSDESLRRLLLSLSQRAEVELAHLEVARRNAGKNL